MTAADLLRAAAERITDWTWCQRELADGAGRYCAVGHIQQAVGVWSDSEYVRAVSALRTMVGDVSSWNDRRDMTAARVRAAMLATADAIDDGKLIDVVEIGVAS